MSLTAIPLVTKLSKNVIRILGCNPGVMTLQGTNTYLVGTGKSRILIDSGDEDTAPDYTKLLDDVLTKENATLEHLIVTHWHHDHVGGAAPVRDLVGSKTNARPTIWKLPRASEDGGGNETGYNVDDWFKLEDEQTLSVEGARLTVKHTPGHTTDHACLVMDDDRVLFSGDCILGEGTAVFEDLSDYMKSLDKILAIRPAIIYPGHGPEIDDPLPKIRYYIAHRAKREAEILQVLGERRKDGGTSEMDIVRRIYKEIAENLWPAAAVNVGHHLEKLLKEGKVMKNDEGLWLVNEKKS